MTTYNGWKNKETWLVNVWYMDDLLQYYTEDEKLDIEAYELKQDVVYIVEEGEALSSLPAGLLADFISDAWAEVDWHALAEHIRATLQRELQA